MMDVKMINISTDFSRYPAGRYRTDGEFTGEIFREDFLLPALSANSKVEILLDGAMAYGSSFLEEAFGGLVRINHIKAVELRNRLSFISKEDPSLVEEIWEYIDESDK
jgi:hypothetical protein